LKADLYDLFGMLRQRWVIAIYEMNAYPTGKRKTHPT
jgi:hypothetical protein